MLKHFALKEFIKQKLTNENRTEINWFIVGQVFNAILNLLIVKLLSALGKEEFGKYTLILTVSALFNLVLNGPLTQTVSRFYYFYKNEERESILIDFLNKYFAFLLPIILAVLLITILFWDADPLLIIFSTVFIVGSELSRMFNALLNTIRKRKLNSLYQLLEKTILVIVILLIVYLFQEGLENYLLYSGIFLLFLSLIKFKSFISNGFDTKIKQKFVFDDLKNKFLPYAFPFLVWGLAGWLQTNGEKWIIDLNLGTDTLGIYGMMFVIASSLVIYPNNFLNEFFTPIIFEKYGSKDPDKFKEAEKYLYIAFFISVSVLLFALFITLFAGESLIILLSNSEFSGLSFMLPYICIGVGFFYSGQVLTILGLAAGKPQIYIVPKILSGLISLLLSFYFSFKFGLEGVVFAVLISGVYYLIHIFYLNKRVLKIL